MLGAIIDEIVSSGFEFNPINDYDNQETAE